MKVYMKERTKEIGNKFILVSSCWVALIKSIVNKIHVLMYIIC